MDRRRGIEEESRQETAQVIRASLGTQPPRASLPRAKRRSLCRPHSLIPTFCCTPPVIIPRNGKKHASPNNYCYRRKLFSRCKSCRNSTRTRFIHESSP